MGRTPKPTQQAMRKVVAFRLTPPQIAALKKRYGRQVSIGEAARRIVLESLGGEMGGPGHRKS